MTTRDSFSFRALAIVTAGLLFFVQAALAGPPLLCRPFDIGNARSLPWEGKDWTSAPQGYDVSRVVDDALAILKADTSVIVRMETLRRATVIARANPALSDALLARLRARVSDSESKGERNPLALFDVGYLVETYRQAHWISGATRETYWKFDVREPSKDLDGYGIVLRAIEQSGADPEMEFAAAMITMGGKLKDKSGEHLRRALAAARAGSLLAHNLTAQFGVNGITTAAVKD